MILLFSRAGRWLVLLALAAGTVMGSPATASSVEDPYSRLDGFASDHMAQTRTPGLAYAVVGPGGVEHVNGFGIDGDGVPITAGSRFLWGSVSKPIAATVVLRLVRDGALELDDRVVDRLPSFRIGDGRTSSRITIRQLLDHTSGLPPALAVTDRDDPQRRPADGVRELRDLATLDDPGETHHYSSANYLVLSAVIEEITGRPYADVLTEQVLEPLDMTGAITSSSGATQSLPPGHRYVAGRTVALDSPFDPAGLAYGYLGGTIDDLAQFARAQLGGVPDVVTDADRTASQEAAVATGSGGSYGLGWRQTVLADFDVDSEAPIVWHSGAAPGYQSAIIVMPEQQRAVVMLQNSYGFFQENALLDASVGAAAIVAGADPGSVPSAGAIYPAILLVLMLIAAACAVSIVRSVLRVVRPRPARSTRRVVRGLAGTLTITVAVIGLLAVVVPGLAGVPLGQVPLWAPDVGWLAMVGIGGAVAAALLRIVVVIRERRPQEAAPAV